MGKVIGVVFIALLLGGCTPFWSKPVVTNDGLCAGLPITPDKGAGARWTRDEKEQVVALNNAGAKICGYAIPE